MYTFIKNNIFYSYYILHHHECSFDFPSPNNIYERELGTTANYNHTNTSKTGDSICKICYVYKCTLHAKIILRFDIYG